MDDVPPDFVICFRYCCRCVEAFLGQLGITLWVLWDLGTRSPLASIAMAPKRKRFEGDLASIAQAMAPFATVPDFLKYEARLNAKTDRDKIMRAKGVLQAIARHHEKLTFTQKTAELLFDQVKTRSGHLWARALTEEENKEWRTTMAWRLRAIARAINNARARGAAWVAELFGDAGDKDDEGDERPDGAGDDEGGQQEDEGEEEEKDHDDEVQPERPDDCDDGGDHEGPCQDGDDDDGDDRAPEPHPKRRKSAKAPDTDWVFGYDSESRKAWRMCTGRPKEFCRELSWPPDASDNDSPIAHWADMSREIKSVTIGELKIEIQARNVGQGKLWKGPGFYISFRRDRFPGILVLYKTTDSRDIQKCQISLRHFGGMETVEDMFRDSYPSKNPPNNR